MNHLYFYVDIFEDGIVLVTMLNKIYFELLWMAKICFNEIMFQNL